MTVLNTLLKLLLLLVSALLPGLSFRLLDSALLNFPLPLLNSGRKIKFLLLVLYLASASAADLLVVGLLS